MGQHRRFIWGAVAVLSSVGLAACASDQKNTQTASAERQGTFEETGRSMDDTVDRTEEHMQQQSEDTQNAIDKARKDTGDYVEQTGEEPTKALQGDSDKSGSNKSDK